ncbi:MAG: RNA-guided pseudouridylation complex pseudouridine synthase subunit Cbf5 [Candidatus Aenigmarchaeota archaeon]|nr:RNA-guided pseudouridylation complex pseudouridine synthase subunit Cbf5 [Candidatus Aenigmarchaeota archaeon]
MSFITRSAELPRYGKYPGARPIGELLENGIVVLDKWPGPTSHDVASMVKNVLGRAKAGHGGTLDPMVSGVLVITLDNACKVIPALQGQDKEYVGIMRLHRDVSGNELLGAVKKFTGEITQRPPVRSAVLRRERKRTVHGFEILEHKDRDVLFRVRCEAGTYVRVLCHKIGELLGGAHMKELRRTAAGRFTEADAVRIHDIADAYADWKEKGSEDIRNYVLPVEAAAEHLGKIIIKDSAVYSVANGSPLYSTGISRIEDTVKKGGMVALLTLRGEFVALGRAEMDATDKRKGVAAKIDRVIMKEPYPNSRFK